MRCGVPACLPLPRRALSGAFAVRPLLLGRGFVTAFVVLFEVLEVVCRDSSLFELLRQLGTEVLVEGQEPRTRTTRTTIQQETIRTRTISNLLYRKFG